MLDKIGTYDLPLQSPLPKQDLITQLAGDQGGSTFGGLLEKAENVSKEGNSEKALEEAAHQMEVLLANFMIKTMDESSGEEGGLLGGSAEGMGYFKDQFYQNIAEEVVKQKGLGFAQALHNFHGSKPLSS